MFSVDIYIYSIHQIVQVLPHYSQYMCIILNRERKKITVTVSL